MLSHKYFFLSLMMTNLYGQGIINGFGLGQLHRYSGPNRAGQGIQLLAPSYKKDVSLSNPTTWPKLKFTNFLFHTEPLEMKLQTRSMSFLDYHPLIGSYH